MHLQDLSRHWARRCLAIPRFCQRVLGTKLSGTTLVVAYSTGLDSTALLYLLNALAPVFNLQLVAAHAHHGLRQASDQELEHAQAVTTQLGIPCVTTHLQGLQNIKPQGQGLEDKARQLRYAFLEQVRRQYQAHWIVTGHHGHDLAEDILLRFLRGTGWPGLGGMVGRDDHRHLLRPLLDWKKDELRDFLVDSGLTWHEDLSNTDTRLTRNRIRQQIMPLLEKENPALIPSCLRLWQLARVDEDYWQQQIPTWPTSESIFLQRKTLMAAHPALRLRIFKAALDALGPGQVLGDHLWQVEHCWQRQSIGKTIQFPGHKICQIQTQGILVKINKGQAPGAQPQTNTDQGSQT